PELTKIIEKMMKVDLKQRYNSMDEVVRDLDLYLENLAVRNSDLESPRTIGPRTTSNLPDDEGYVEETETETDESFRPDGFEVKAFVPKKLLCVEVQEEVQSAFRKFLSKLGYRVLLVADPERAA